MRGRLAHAANGRPMRLNAPLAYPLVPRRAPARRRRGTREVSLSSSSSRYIAAARGARRFSPERPYRPRVSPPSVEDRDACAIYASVRKDATPEPRARRARAREPPEDAPPRRERRRRGRRLRHPGRHPAQDLGRGGSRRRPQPGARAATRRSRSRHVFIERSEDVEKARHDAREILGRGGFRILAERLGVVDSQALGATAREEEPHFWQVAGAARPTPSAAIASPST